MSELIFVLINRDLFRAGNRPAARVMIANDTGPIEGGACPDSGLDGNRFRAITRPARGPSDKLITNQNLALFPAPTSATRNTQLRQYCNLDFKLPPGRTD